MMLLYRISGNCRRILVNAGFGTAEVTVCTVGTDSLSGCPASVVLIGWIDGIHAKGVGPLGGVLCGLKPGADIGAIGGGMGILVDTANPVTIGPILPPFAVRIIRRICIWFSCDSCRSMIPV